MVNVIEKNMSDVGARAVVVRVVGLSESHSACEFGRDALEDLLLALRLLVGRRVEKDDDCLLAVVEFEQSVFVEDFMYDSLLGIRAAAAAGAAASEGEDAGEHEEVKETIGRNVCSQTLHGFRFLGSGGWDVTN